jgi:hypothetical protein
VHLQALALAIVALLLSGCAERSLTRQQLSSIAEIDVVVGVAQDELALQRIEPFQAQMPTSTYRTTTSPDAALGAAVGEAVIMIIAAAIVGRRDRRIMELKAYAAPAKQALQGYDFRPDLLSATQDTLTKVRSVKVDVQPVVLTDSLAGTVRQAYERSTASAVLFFLAAYSFEEGNGGYGLAFRSSAMMFPKSAGLKALRRRPNDADPVDEGNAIHLKTAEIFLPYDGRADIREVVKQGARALAAQLAADLEPAK